MASWETESSEDPSVLLGAKLHGWFSWDVLPLPQQINALWLCPCRLTGLTSRGSLASSFWLVLQMRTLDRDGKDGSKARHYPWLSPCKVPKGHGSSLGLLLSTILPLCTPALWSSSPCPHLWYQYLLPQFKCCWNPNTFCRSPPTCPSARDDVVHS